MFTNIHNRFSEKKFNFYDYTIGALIGTGAATGSLIPLAPILVLGWLSFKGVSNDTSN
jgi:hypothetical protein